MRTKILADFQIYLKVSLLQNVSVRNNRRSSRNRLNNCGPSTEPRGTMTCMFFGAEQFLSSLLSNYT